MIIHVVNPGETVSIIAQRYGVSPQRLIFDNQLNSYGQLVVGQSLVILIPKIVHTVVSGENIYSIARDYQIPFINIIRNNPYLSQNQELSPGDTIVINYNDQKIGNIKVNGYAYPFIQRQTLNETLPYLSELSVFSYGFTTSGDLIPVYDTFLISKAKEFNVNPILTLTPFGSDGKFNNSLVTAISSDLQARTRLIQNLLKTVQTKGYSGVNIDFEYVLEDDRYSYTEFVEETTRVMNANGYTTSVALAPKTSSNQQGLLYEGIDYKLLGQNSNSVLVMTYEWGYTYGPPMAVAPLNKVKEVLDYTITQIPPQKIDMGIPNYGYDWKLPYVRGETEATIVGNPEAINIALANGATIQFDNTAMSPYFEYTKSGSPHIVWFEDARSINSKLVTASQYGFRGVGYWNLMRYFRQNWLILNSLFEIL